MMTPEHPQWIEFYNRLSEAVTENGCTSQPDRPSARQILAAIDFDDEEISASLEYFEGEGGFCDCEILMNVGVEMTV